MNTCQGCSKQTTKRMTPFSDCIFDIINDALNGCPCRDCLISSACTTICSNFVTFLKKYQDENFHKLGDNNVSCLFT